MKSLVFLVGVVLLLAHPNLAKRQSVARSQEVSDVDGIPVILKHLPDSEHAPEGAIFIPDRQGMRDALGERPVLDAIEFSAGTEAASAKYTGGTVLIVEYPNPQAATDADAKITAQLASSAQSGVVYRRIGNYAAFVLDAADLASANALLDQIKYQKSVQWLDKDPYYLKKLETVFVYTTTNMLVGSVVVVVGGVIGSAILGLIIGYIYFRLGSRKRLSWTAYSDAGGLTRLNLDELSEPILPAQLR
jgi:hypothetical protein